MSVTILEALQNGNANLDNMGILGMALLPMVKDQINNATVLLEKGYDLYELVEPLIEKHGSLDSVPDINKY